MTGHSMSRRAFIGSIAGLLALGAAGCLPRPASVVSVPSSPASEGPTPIPTIPTPAPVLTVPSAPTAVPSPVPTSTPTPVQAPKLVSREAWGARKASGQYRTHEPSRITIHHTAVVWKRGDTAKHLQGIQDFHMGPERGWVDIAYHYLIARDGVAYVGRPEPAMPDTATAGYDTRGHLAVCLLGDFDAQQ